MIPWLLLLKILIYCLICFFTLHQYLSTWVSKLDKTHFDNLIKVQYDETWSLEVLF
jgi:hypothetical protein